MTKITKFIVSGSRKRRFETIEAASEYCQRYFDKTGVVLSMELEAPTEAIQVPCPGVVNDGLFGHSMRDGCWCCAPHWEQFPVCPVHKTKVNDKGWCKTCKKHYTLPKQLDLAKYRYPPSK